MVETTSNNNLLIQRYEQLVEQGHITKDAAQEEVVSIFQQLYNELQDYNHNSKNWFFWGKKNQNVTQNNIYLWGGVGRGKTMLMDLFYDAIHSKLPAQRIHYHAFMSDIHDRMRIQRQQQPSGHDMLAIVAAKYMSKLQLLCIDEFQVHDITDAMILSRLFSLFLNAGLVVVITSNVPPDDLYKDGLQREYFLEFIQLLKDNFTVLELTSAADYRMEKLRNCSNYFCPADNIGELQRVFNLLVNRTPSSTVLRVKGRNIELKNTANGVVWCHFDELCKAALGAEDYIAIAKEFHTLFLQAIPLLRREDRNEAKRFINLIDILYEHRVKLFCSADGRPEEIYIDGDGSFEFQRTISRLYEMQSDEYFNAAHIV